MDAARFSDPDRSAGPPDSPGDGGSVEYVALTSRTTPRAPRPLIELEVVGSVRLNPHLVRVTLGGPGFAQFEDRPDTDKYVKLRFTAPEGHPVTRTYTVRRVDAAAQTLDIDFVVHGDEGLAGPWAATAEPGDTADASWDRAAATARTPTRTGTCCSAICPRCRRSARRSRRCSGCRRDRDRRGRAPTTRSSTSSRPTASTCSGSCDASRSRRRSSPTPCARPPWRDGARRGLRARRAGVDEGSCAASLRRARARRARRSRSRATGRGAAPRTASRPRSASRSARSSPRPLGRISCDLRASRRRSARARSTPPSSRSPCASSRRQPRSSTTIPTTSPSARPPPRCSRTSSASPAATSGSAIADADRAVVAATATGAPDRIDDETRGIPLADPRRSPDRRRAASSRAPATSASSSTRSSTRSTTSSAPTARR